MRRPTIHEEEDLTVIDHLKKSGKGGSPPGDGRLSASLTIIYGSEVDFGKHFSFSENRISVGRDKSCRIKLEDSKVSKKHCEFAIFRDRDLDQVIVRDLDSTNGTYVNGRAVDQAVLNSGDKITIGDTVLRLNYNDEIEDEYHARLFNFAATDALTGLYNRRYIFNELENQLRIARRNTRIFSILIFDIDNFKQINDVHGHLAGDDYLRKLAFTVNQALREQDICGRIGGEEFLIILPETALKGAVNLADRLREKVGRMVVPHHDITIQATISIGVSQFGLHAAERRLLVKKADLALQEAKKSGKNMVVEAAVK